jgi:thiosulfate/3-mercaptopyruvate sulfurtransferase
MSSSQLPKIALLPIEDFASQIEAPGSLLFEVDSSDLAYINQGHIPGAVFFDTNQIEQSPDWNFLPFDQINIYLAHMGITSDSQVFLYSRRSIAAARLAHFLLVMGIGSINILDGGWSNWQSGQMPIEHASNASVPVPIPTNGNPANPQFLVDQPAVKTVLAAKSGNIVSVRSHPEFQGETSGYDFIGPQGRIPGAIWAGAGDDKDGMQLYHRSDGRAKPLKEIAQMWQARGITPQNKTIFYCGTGWRASEAFLYAYLLGWPDIAVYDGGWHEWSSDPANPIDSG